jgi:S1-C subfamily serine protease
MSDNVLKDFSDAWATIIENIAPSVVRVEARRRLPATGIVWNEEGVIVTAHHVVEDDEDIRIGLDDGSTVDATLVGRDPHNDLAVLKAEGTFTPATWAKAEDIKVGHLVLAVGRPFNDLQATLGVVSARSDLYPLRSVHGHEHAHEHEHDYGRGRGGSRHGRRPRRGRRPGGAPKIWWSWRGKYHHGFGRMLAGGHIRTDVVMYPGFSGGPLVSAYGTVYGLNSSGFLRGASLTVPVGVVEKSVSALLAHGRVPQGYLGVRVQTVNLPDAVAAELEQETGVLVVMVEEDSPAQKGGLLVGDIIVAVAGESIAEADELPAALIGDLVGKELTLGIVRGGEVKEITVTIGEQT